MAVSFEEERKKFLVLLGKYTQCADYLLQKCENLKHIHGMQKLRRKCEAEIKYLKLLRRNVSSCEESHITSSNLSNYLGIIDAVENLKDVTQVLQAFWSPRRADSLHADVVAGKGQLWVKVVARKAQSLHQIWAGQGQYGERDLMQLARDFVECAAVHPVHFVEPKVVFIFYNGVTFPMAAALNALGVITLGEKMAVSADILKLVPEVPEPFRITDPTDGQTNDTEKDMDVLELLPGGQALEKNRTGCLGADIDIEERGNAHGTTQSKCPDPVDENYMEKAVSNYSSETKSSLPDGNKNLLDSVIRSERFGAEEGTGITERLSSVKLKGILEVSVGKKATERLPDPVTSFETNVATSHVKLDEDPVKIDPQRQSANESETVADEQTSVTKSVQIFIASRLLTCIPRNYRELNCILTANSGRTIDNIRQVNLDITALITLVSAVTHGRCNFVYQEKILTEQAAEERIDPVLPKLQQFLEGKRLYACQTAVSEFRTILDTLGGEEERIRADDLLRTVTIVLDNPSLRTQKLPPTGKIKDRSKVIFGTGDSLKAVTVTANSGFVRAAEHQGVLFSVFLHASRALTEQKEKTATPL